MRHLDTLFVPKFASIKDWFFSEELAAGRLCEELHELMLESEHPAFVLDVDERFVALNEKWKGLCGFTPSEVLLKSPKELLQGKKTNSAKAQAFAKEIRRDGTAKTTLVYYRKDGEVLVLQLTATRVTDLSGSVFVFTVGREVTDPAARRRTILGIADMLAPCLAETNRIRTMIGLEPRDPGAEKAMQTPLPGARAINDIPLIYTQAQAQGGADLQRGRPNIPLDVSPNWRVEALTVRRKSRELAIDISSMGNAASSWRSSVARYSVGGKGDELVAVYSDEHLKHVFAKFDKDGNGQLSKDEIDAAVKKLNPNAGAELIEQMIDFADRDGDGQISFDEFCTIMRFGFTDSDEPAAEARTRRPSASAAAGA